MLIATEVNADDQTARASTEGASTARSPKQPPMIRPSASSPMGMTSASSSCSPLRTSNIASVAHGGGRDGPAEQLPVPE